MILIRKPAPFNHSFQSNPLGHPPGHLPVIISRYAGWFSQEPHAIGTRVLRPFLRWFSAEATYDLAQSNAVARTGLYARVARENASGSKRFDITQVVARGGMEGFPRRNAGICQNE